MTEIKMITEVKDGKRWIETYNSTDELQVYKNLCDNLISKKLENCKYIKSIKRIQLYNGFLKIIVTYDNDCRTTYIVKD